MLVVAAGGSKPAVACRRSLQDRDDVGSVLALGLQIEHLPAGDLPSKVVWPSILAEPETGQRFRTPQRG